MDESMITRVHKGEDRVVVIMDRRLRGGARGWGPTFWVGRYLTFVNFPISVAVASDSGWAACLNSCKLAPCGTPRLSVRRAYTVNS
jgi:hypothetical protein